MALDPVLTGDYTLDPAHSTLGFVARHALVTKVRGTFNEVSGTGHLDAADPSRSRISFTAAVDSVDTRNEQRDGHLRTNDFFDAANHPEISFVSTSIVPQSHEDFTVTGDLTIRGKSNPITFELELAGPVTDPWGATRIGLEGSVRVDRHDWDLNWNTPMDSGGLLLSDKVTLTFDVSATKDA